MEPLWSPAGATGGREVLSLGQESAHQRFVRPLPEEPAAEIRPERSPFLNAQSVEDLSALLTSAGER
jgi:hypothetical protein